MSASVNVLGRAEALRPTSRESSSAQAFERGETGEWNPELFMREQILGLVRRVFLPNGGHPANHVVFSAIEARIDLPGICRQVAQALARETKSKVALVDSQAGEGMAGCGFRKGAGPIDSRVQQLEHNLWRVTTEASGNGGTDTEAGFDWPSFLARLRSEFQYAVINGPAAAKSSEAAFMAQNADGIILVLGAHTTRRTTARSVKAALEGAQSRILGTVLAERRFPIPERIYRRL
jgi:hypothetical protein